MTLVTLSFRPVDGDPEDVSQIIADFDDILAVLNGDIRDDNVAAGAAIAYSKLALAGKIKNSDVQAAAAIAYSKLALAGAVKDTDLVSPANSVHRMIAEAAGSIGVGGAVANGTYLFRLDNPGLILSGVAAGYVPSIFQLNAADYVVAGKTTKLTLRVILLTNGTALGATAKVGMYPITSGGAANSINVTAGAVVAGSEVTFTTPATDSVLTGVAADFTLPADGVYAFAVNISGGPTAANSYATAQMSLRVRHV